MSVQSHSEEDGQPGANTQQELETSTESTELPNLLRLQDTIFDYCSPSHSERRKYLLNKLSSQINHQQVPARFWAMCQICDIDVLERLASRPTLRSAASKTAIETGHDFDIINSKIARAIWAWSGLERLKRDLEWSAWEQRMEDEIEEGDTSEGEGGPMWEATSVTTQGPPLPLLQAPYRYPYITGYCLRRDAKCCALTRSSFPEAVRIYPVHLIPSNYSPRLEPSSSQQEDIDNIWDVLATFFCRDKVTRWKRLVDEGDCVQNSISLNDHSNWDWDYGYMALMPTHLSPEKDVLKLKHFWILRDGWDLDIGRERRNAENGDGLIDLRTSWSHLTNIGYKGWAPEHDRWPPGYEELESGDERSKVLKSGDEVTMTTLDTTRLPLPNVELLEVRWIFSVVLGLTGGFGKIAGLREDSRDLFHTMRGLGNEEQDHMLDAEKRMRWDEKMRKIEEESDVDSSEGED